MRVGRKLGLCAHKHRPGFARRRVVAHGPLNVRLRHQFGSGDRHLVIEADAGGPVLIGPAASPKVVTPRLSAISAKEAEDHC